MMESTGHHAEVHCMVKDTYAVTSWNKESDASIIHQGWYFGNDTDIKIT
jgi:hypothetical protein